MKTNLRVITFYLFTYAFTSCSGVCDCEKISNSTTYDEAVSKAKDCGASDNKVTFGSSWIREISFYKCDATNGFLIIKTDKDQYIHSGVPKTVWLDFKNADSYGEFYNRNLKGRFRFSFQK